MSEIDEQLRTNLTTFQDALQQVDEMVEQVPGMGLSVPVDDTVKRQLKRELFDRHHEEYQRLAALKRQEVQQNMSQARQQLFRPRPGITETPAEVQMSMRDAMDRLQGVTDPSELSARLATSAEMGDRIMAQAILRTTVDAVGNIGEAGPELVRQYLSHYPNEQESYYRLEDASQEQEKLAQFGVPFTPLNPEDVSASFGRGAGPTETSGSGNLIPDGIVGSVETSTGGAGGE